MQPHPLQEGPNDIDRLDGFILVAKGAGTVEFRSGSATGPLLWSVKLKKNEPQGFLFAERIGDGEGVWINWSSNKELQGSLFWRDQVPI